MKKINFMVCALLFLMCGCGSGEQSKTIHIAVTGSPSSYSEYFERGIQKAYKDVCEEYKDSGFEIICDFYDDKDDFETGEKITAELVKQNDITAIISSVSPDICENQAYQTNAARKLLICPHWLNDDTLNDGNYDMLFSVNLSNKDVGLVMRDVANSMPDKRWVVCAAKDTACQEEARAFFNSGEITIYDFCEPNELNSYFEIAADRWKSLGVNGIILLPYDKEGFSLLYKLKEKMPDIYVISDNSLDDYNELINNREYFENVFIVPNFFSLEEKYKGKFEDTFEEHGYSSFRLVVDTAVKNNTAAPEKIAEILHNDGYMGEYETYSFDTNGSLIPAQYTYTVFDKTKDETYTALFEGKENAE